MAFRPNVAPSRNDRRLIDMDSERLKLVEEIYHEAADLPPRSFRGFWLIGAAMTVNSAKSRSRASFV
ncbi:MAG: hypothetical protein IPG58_17635 [Acidobacteria bacterium]|nr:hypothetical protein [Acidobacteriota bacterium]